MSESELPAGVDAEVEVVDGVIVGRGVRIKPAGAAQTAVVVAGTAVAATVTLIAIRRVRKSGQPPRMAR